MLPSHRLQALATGTQSVCAEGSGHPRCFLRTIKMHMEPWAHTHAPRAWEASRRTSEPCAPLLLAAVQMALSGVAVARQAWRMQSSNNNGESRMQSRRSEPSRMQSLTDNQSRAHGRPRGGEAGVARARVGRGAKRGHLSPPKTPQTRMPRCRKHTHTHQPPNPETQQHISLSGRAASRAAVGRDPNQRAARPRGRLRLRMLPRPGAEGPSRPPTERWVTDSPECEPG